MLAGKEDASLTTLIYSTPRLLIHISWMALNYRKKYIARLALPSARWLLSTPPHPQPGERPPTV